MKKLFSTLIVAIAAFPLFAQFVPGPQQQSALTTTTAFLLPGVTTTNIPSTLAPVFRVGPNGVGIALYVSATNSASTTNATVILEPVAFDGTTVRAIGNQTYTFSFPQNGTSGYLFYTNLPNTTANLLNIPGLRVKSIQNTNLSSIWISNATAYVRF